MDHCLACGRELPPGQGEVCPQCQAEGKFAPAPGARKTIPHQVTLALIAANVAVFLLMVGFGGSVTSPGADFVAIWGGNRGLLTIFHQQYWRLWTSNYLHFGIVHLLLNMYCLWGLGRLVELFYGRRDYLLLYTFTGIAGSVASVAVHHPFATSAGASGAVFGVAGVLLTTLKFGRLPVPDAARTALFKEILQFAGINLVLGIFVLRVDNAGHLGGFFSGLLVGWLMGKHLDPSEPSRDRRRTTWMALWLGLLVFFWAVLAAWRWLWVR